MRTVSDLVSAPFVPLINQLAAELARLGNESLQVAIDTSWRDEEERCRRGEFAAMTEVQDLRDLADAYCRLQASAVLFALVIMPRALVPILGKKTDHIAAHISGACEPLDLHVLCLMVRPLADEFF